MNNSLKQMNYVLQVATEVRDRYAGDYWEAINVAETITLKGDLIADASRVYNIMQGEL